MPRLATQRLQAVLLVLLLAVVSSPAFRLPQSFIQPLPSWNKTPTRNYILQFIDQATNPSDPAFIPTEERVAVFDLDGTLLCEKPEIIQNVVAEAKLKEAAGANPALAQEQPWKSVLTGNHDYLHDGKAYEEFVLRPFQGMSEAEYIRYVETFMSTQKHPRFNLYYNELFYQPMVELMSLLVEKQFDVYVVSGAQTGFIRAATSSSVNVPPSKTIGSRITLRYTLEGGRPKLIRGDRFLKPVNLNDGKPENIWEEIGRPPVFAVGNSSGDSEMLSYATQGPRKGLALVLNHDDARREYAYSDQALLDEAGREGWVIISMQTDFKTIFLNP